MSDQLNPENSPRSGRHRLDEDYDDFSEFDDYDYSYDDDYDDEAYDDAYEDAYIVDEDDRSQDYDARPAAAAGAGAAVGAAGAAGAAGAGTAAAAPVAPTGDSPAQDYPADDFVTEDPAETSGDGRSLRILAVTCLIIGLALIGYGIYAYSTGDDANGADNATEATSGAADPANQDPAGPDAPPADPGATEVPPAPDGQPPADPANPDDPAGPDAAAPAPEIDRGRIAVTVLNNSRISGLAEDVSVTMGEQGWRRGEVGNAPENEAGVWERTTVYFDPRNGAERAAAEQIARDNGWVAEPRDGRLEGRPAGIVVVATDDARR